MNRALWVERFRDHLEVSHWSATTIRTYGQALGHFLDFLDACEVRSLGELSRDLIEEYRAHLYAAISTRGQRLSIYSQCRHLSAVRHFTRFLCEAQFLPTDPAAGVRLPKQPEPVPKPPLSVREVCRFLDALDVRNGLGVRNRAICELLYSSGLRASELCALTLETVDLEHGEVRIERGKGGRSRVVPIGREAKVWMTAYRDEVRPGLIGGHRSPVFFLTHRGQRFCNIQLACLVRRAIAATGQQQRVTPHVLRACCATHMLDAGANLRYVQELLGHRSLLSTKRYLHVAITKLQKAHRRFHPRERKCFQ